MFQTGPVTSRVALPSRRPWRSSSGPGWTRTTDFPHVKGTSSPLDDETGLEAGGSRFHPVRCRAALPGSHGKRLRVMAHHRSSSSRLLAAPARKSVSTPAVIKVKPRFMTGRRAADEAPK